eukprot:137600-Rhodomonas_salina.1
MVESKSRCALYTSRVGVRDRDTAAYHRGLAGHGSDQGGGCDWQGTDCEDHGPSFPTVAEKAARAGYLLATHHVANNT